MHVGQRLENTPIPWAAHHICRPGCEELAILHVTLIDVEPFVLSSGTVTFAIVNAHPEEVSGLIPARPI